MESLLLLALIEGIFLAEKLAGILEDAILAKMTASEIGLTLVATAPEIFDLALPSAIVIAVYRVMLRLREDSELVIIAGTGIGADALVTLFVALAVPAMLSSLLVSGFVEPHSRFLQRETLFDSAYRALREESVAGEYHFPNGYTVFVDPKSPDGRGHRLFLHRSLNAATDRVVVAKRSRLSPDKDGWFTLRMQDFSVYDFASSKGLDSQRMNVTRPAKPQMGLMRIGNFQQELAVNSLIYFAPRISASEQTLPELITGHFWTESMLRIFKSLLCLFAPISALLGVTFTERRSLFAALPGAVLMLMSIDIGETAFLRSYETQYPIAAALCLAAVALILFVSLCRMLIARQDKLLKPVLGG